MSVYVIMATWFTLGNSQLLLSLQIKQFVVLRVARLQLFIVTELVCGCRGHCFANHFKYVWLRKKNILATKKEFTLLKKGS